MRQLFIIPLRNLRRRRFRTGLTLGMTGLGTALIVFTLGLTEGTYSDMIRMATRSWAGHFQVTAEALHAMEREAKRLSANYEVRGQLAICDARRRRGPYDKTELLLIGQRLAPISLVHDETTVTVAARFDSGIDLVSALGLNGGMPTRVSVAAKRLDEVLEVLGRFEVEG